MHITTRKPSKRYRPLAVPGDDRTETAWFVYDTKTMRSEPAADHEDARAKARRRNANVQ